jgi:hypothetical protein
MKIKGNVKLLKRNVLTDEVEIKTLHNVSCTAGAESLAARMVGAEKGQVTYFALGTGASTGGDAPAEADTTLDTELTRKQISVRTSSTDTASFRIFFNTSEGNGSLTEVGLFGDDATSTTDSGTLFARAAISTTKTDSETLTIDWDLSVDATT